MKEIINGKVKFIAVPVDIDNEVISGTLLGKLTELTEKQCAGLVHSIHVEEMPSPYNDMGGGYHYAFMDYENTGEYSGWGGDAGCYTKAKDSLKSLLQSNGLNLKSWIELEKIHRKAESDGTLQTIDWWRNKLSEAAEEYLIILIDKKI